MVLALLLVSFSPKMLPALELSGMSNETIPGYKTLSLTPANLSVFLERVKRERDELYRELEEKYGGDAEKISKSTALWAYDRLIAASIPIGTQLEEADEGDDETAIRQQFLELQRIHYGILSDLGKRPKGLAYLSATLISFLSTAAHVCAGPLLLALPRETKPELPIGSGRAGSEADNLFADRGTGPLGPDSLAKLSPIEISRLEPPSTHPVLDEGNAGPRFNAKFGEIQDSIRALNPKYSKFDYAHARRVVFFDEIKAEATSPKITVKDRHGIKWKMKWGDEVHTDVAAGRLYLDIGGRYSDPKFYSGPGETILVLPQAKAGQEGISTFQDLKNAVSKAFFRFKLEEWVLDGPMVKDDAGKILGSGIVDARMADTEDIDKKYIGAFFVKFKECQMSIYNPACKRLGGSPLSGLGATRDRIQRGMMLFNIWINNIDAKDDNTRISFLYNPKTQDFDRAAEFQSDSGATFGKIVGIGKPNFFSERWIVETPFGIHFLFRPVFVPRAWTACTWSDARWMARRICSLSRDDISAAIADSGWPGFVQQVMVEKLLARRNQLVPIFRLDQDGFQEIPCNPRLTIGEGDVLVKDGKLNRKSARIKKLVEEFHPEGFIGIQFRFLN